ncbi:hypothetical protein G1K97_10320 [Tenacibaculum finnmarkense]|uniref:hypothetical protein n=1 Tax=Tenacibaculum finnmarkense TaxID=2781243 RepID=UPI001EFADD2E|nr:hypothetical protein [Tenacibaculum finnmarkense]MCG8902234.1 hypothetical protein [Tenacibaculum finnmarkense]
MKIFNKIYPILVSVFLLSEEYIIKKGGEYYIDKFQTKWIDYGKTKKDARSFLRLYNYGEGFNVYLVSLDKEANIIQLTTIKRTLTFKILTMIIR